ncbi:methionyl-tRNA formyltransferase [Selenomonas sp. TAMA-11512]|uniref:methionyl-tRNA formyltransferase n=1 Tax=Selenomonas sp. TAMA-11512 TaxID=3095337 RepID=UPI0030905CBC|nr:methionyl-tRNA formyltransferase [Selenomonas sp. TAMA-11512]
MSKLRTIFMGTPEFAVPCLQKLLERTDVQLVVTQPDRPKGRGQKMVPPPVKIVAEEAGITVFQPVKVREAEAVERIRAVAPDLIVVVAFGQILPKDILDIPVYGCINVHASLLPKYRGAAPMQWAILHGETETGVTTMFMDEGLDTGDMLLSEKFSISPDMTAEELHDAMMPLGADVLARTVSAVEAGTLERTPQDDAASSYASMLTKELGAIDWTKPAQELHNLVRGLNSRPGAYAVLADEDKLKIWHTRLPAATPEGLAEGGIGDIVGRSKDGFYVKTGAGLLEVVEVQPPNRKKMRAADYLRGLSGSLQFAK